MLLQKSESNAPLSWSNDEITAFNTLRQNIKCCSSLQLPRVNVAFTVETDASNEALGAVLLQRGKAVEYASRLLNKSEQNYSTFEEELLAIMFALKKFRQYLLGAHFIL